jgi:RNase adaptor protein for sRNA GlmZ degradation
VAWETLKARVAKAVIVEGAGTVAIGCTGGRHRSVYLVERLGREWGVAIEHRDLGK